MSTAFTPERALMATDFSVKEYIAFFEQSFQEKGSVVSAAPNTMEVGGTRVDNYTFHSRLNPILTCQLEYPDEIKQIVLKRHYQKHGWQDVVFGRITPETWTVTFEFYKADFDGHVRSQVNNH